MAAMGISPNAVGKKVTQRILSGAFKGGGTEALTETFQTAAERIQSGAPIDQVFDEEGIDQLKNAFVGGALLGTGAGGVAGGIRGPRPEPIVNVDPDAVPPAGEPQGELDLDGATQPATTSGLTTDYATDAEKLAEYDALMAPLREVVLDSKGEKIKEESPLEKAKREYEEANPVSKPAAKAPKETQLDLLDENKAKSPTTAAERADNRVLTEAEKANTKFDRDALAAAKTAQAEATRAKKAQERADKTEAAKDLKEAEKTALVAKKAQERADKAKAKTEPRTAEPTVEEDTSEIDLAANLAASKAQTETDQGRDVEGVEDTAAVNEKVNADMQAAPTVEDIYTPNAEQQYIDGIVAPVEPRTAGDKVKAVKPSDKVISNFTTARGSTYTQYDDTTTVRDRASSGDKESTGIQPRSGKTIFMSKEDVDKWGPLFQQGDAGLYQLLPNSDGTANLVFTEDYGPKKAGSAATPPVPFSIAPKVGMIPVEIMDSKNTKRRNIHFGSKIIEVSDGNRTAGDKVEATPVVEPVVPDTVEASLDRDAVGVGAAGRGLRPEDVPAGIKGVDSTPKPVGPTTEPIADVEARDNVH